MIGMRFGDKVEIAVKPIAKAMKSKCLDDNGRLIEGSPCYKIKNALNGQALTSETQVVRINS